MPPLAPGPHAVAALPVPGGAGVAVTTPAGSWSSPAPVQVLHTRPGADAPRTVAVPYAALEPDGDGLRGTAEVLVAPGCTVVVTDRWTAGPAAAVHREVRVRGSGAGGFATAVGLVRDGAPHGWAEVEVVAPGLVYGDARPVSTWTLGGPDARRSGVRDVLVREDRLSAPHLTVRYADGAALTVHRDGGTRATVAADGVDELGGVVVDERVDLAALGGRVTEDGVAVGAAYPAAEGEHTYTSGGLPLTGVAAWRQTLHPLRDGLRHAVRLGWEATSGGDRVAVLAHARDRAWRRHRPAAEPVAAGDHVRAVARVLASQVQRPAPGLAGVALESDPLRGRPVPGSTASVMGFVGAGTDAGYCLLRAAGLEAPAAARSMAGRGAAVLDTFAGLPLDPPAGEGFDLVTGRPTTYRTLDGEPAVFARALAEGCHAALRASAYASDPARAVRWHAWAMRGAGFLRRAQRPDGSLPRAWRAGDGRVLQDSGTATATAVPFLLAAAADDPACGEAAERAAEHAWSRAAEHLAYAGATLDNPDVVDKEGALLAARAFLALHRSTGEDRWLRRALHAARVAESWVHLVDLPVPADAPADALHWKPGRSTVGLQLITTGVTMSDGFLVADAALFAELALRSGEAWPARVARLVHHGSVAMLATAARPLDLAGPGWQQEHWGLGPRRGYGLNRHWLPWTAVAVLDGYFRVRDLGEQAEALVGLDG